MDKILNGESPYAELSNSSVYLSNEYFPFCFQFKDFKVSLVIDHFFFPLEGVFLPPLAVDALFRLLLGDGDLSLSLAASAACASSFCFSASRNFCL